MDCLRKPEGSISGLPDFSNPCIYNISIQKLFVSLIMKFLILFCLLVISLSGFSQVDSTLPPYKKYPTVPPFQILLSDSSTMYTKAKLPQKKPVFVIVFSPECSHCQHDTEELIARKDELKDVQIVMITMHPLWMMNEFIEKYKLKELDNVVVGRDLYYIMPSFFDMHNLPFIALYDKNGDLVPGSERAGGIGGIIEMLKKK